MLARVFPWPRGRISLLHWCSDGWVCSGTQIIVSVVGAGLRLYFRGQKVGLHRPQRSCVAPVDRTSGVLHGVKDAFCTTRNAATQSMVDRSSGPGTQGDLSAATVSFSLSARCGNAGIAFSPLGCGDERSECARGAGSSPGAAGRPPCASGVPYRDAGCPRPLDSRQQHPLFRPDLCGQRFACIQFRERVESVLFDFERLVFRFGAQPGSRTSPVRRNLGPACDAEWKLLGRSWRRRG